MERRGRIERLRLVIIDQRHRLNPCPNLDLARA